jgi:hypothetical protein
MSKPKLEHKLSAIIKLIDSIGLKYGTLSSYFVHQHSERTGEKFLTLTSREHYPDIVELASSIMFNEDRLYNLIDELMTDYIRELTGKNIDKILKKYTHAFSNIERFYNKIKFDDNKSPSESFKIKLLWTSGIDNLFKQTIFDLRQKTEKTLKLMQDFEKLLSVKGKGTEPVSIYGGRVDIPRKYM